MRDFFKDLLQNLDKLTGMKQYEKLCQTANPKEEIKTLLDILCRVTSQYDFIPDSAKKQIIQDAIISDPEFIGLNAKFVAKSLNMRSDFFRKQNEDITISEDALTGEERGRRIAEWLQAVNKVESAMTQPCKDDFSFLKEIKPVDGQEYKSKTSLEDLLNHSRHVEYLKQNYDPGTGKPLPTWVSEDTFNSEYDKQFKPT